MPTVYCYCGGRYVMRTYGDFEATEGEVRRMNSVAYYKHCNTTKHLLSEGKKVNLEDNKRSRPQVREQQIEFLIKKYDIEQVGINQHRCKCGDNIIKRHSILNHCIGNYSHRMMYAVINYNKNNEAQYTPSCMDEEELLKLYYDPLEGYSK
jgi:hypothetical protein